jgi:hypothetical protein
MQTKLKIFAAAALAGMGAAGGAALAQPVIDPASKFSWQENTGWMNWSADPGAGQSVLLARSFLSGAIWCENIGWISVGHGPVDGRSYRNQSGTDYGVNMVPTTGILSGYAWSENAGWVNFSGGSLASPPNPARLDVSLSRFNGFAWGENVGWVNLSDAGHFVRVLGLCRTDLTGDGRIDVSDFLAFLSLYSVASPRVDFDGDGQVNVRDFLAFLRGFAAGC